MMLSKIFNLSNYFAFTLAEVLITLGIIGVVAAITIPTLMQKYQDNLYQNAYKKAFSVASQAWLSAFGNGDIQVRTISLDNTTDVLNFTNLKEYFKVIKDCNAGNNSECWASGQAFYGTRPSTDAPAFIDSSGMAWVSCSSATLACGGGDFFVDTNGAKMPNKWGQDRFGFTPITQDDEAFGGPLIKLVIQSSDCLDTVSCPNYTNICQSVATHPCYFKSWITGTGGN